ncbi:hypothetical protein [uncultured Sunxiuqinia sp.]|uniref:hypothetical protein n=1 Tax=uncultured Sunxiuqinia sp. TaxID=1573825 RepID=UPI002AA90B33|nr:hypothetical protein [uncultured Sunxiuqinia sp.]
MKLLVTIFSVFVLFSALFSSTGERLNTYSLNSKDQSACLDDMLSRDIQAGFQGVEDEGKDGEIDRLDFQWKLIYSIIPFDPQYSKYKLHTISICLRYSRWLHEIGNLSPPING